jgi:hypothetical protein
MWLEAAAGHGRGDGDERRQGVSPKFDFTGATCVSSG